MPPRPRPRSPATDIRPPKQKKLAHSVSDESDTVSEESASQLSPAMRIRTPPPEPATSDERQSSPPAPDPAPPSSSQPDPPTSPYPSSPGPDTTDTTFTFEESHFTEDTREWMTPQLAELFESLNTVKDHKHGRYSINDFPVHASFWGRRGIPPNDPSRTLHIGKGGDEVLIRAIAELSVNMLNPDSSKGNRVSIKFKPVLVKDYFSLASLICELSNPNKEDAAEEGGFWASTWATWSLGKKSQNNIRKFDAMYDGRLSFSTRKTQPLQHTDFERGDIIVVDFKVARWKLGTAKASATGSVPPSPVKTEPSSSSGLSASPMDKLAWTTWGVQLELVALTLLHRPPFTSAPVSKDDDDDDW